MFTVRFAIILAVLRVTYAQTVVSASSSCPVDLIQRRSQESPSPLVAHYTRNAMEVQTMIGTNLRAIESSETLPDGRVISIDESQRTYGLKVIVMTADPPPHLFCVQGPLITDNGVVVPFDEYFPPTSLVECSWYVVGAVQHEPRNANRGCSFEYNSLSCSAILSIVALTSAYNKIQSCLIEGTQVVHQACRVA